MGSRMTQIDVLAWVAAITAIGGAIYAATRQEWGAVVALLAMSAYVAWVTTWKEGGRG